MSRSNPPSRRRHGATTVSLARTIALVLSLPLWLLFAVPDATAETYRLEVGDTLQVTVFGEPDLGGRFAIGPDGTIGYPRLGRVAMAGLTEGEAAERVSNGLLGRIAAGQTVSIDIVAHRPVYVTGDVQSPGRYAYHPGIIVLELVALAGGLRRPEQPNGDAPMQLLSAQQDLADARLIRWSQRVTMARLTAEITDQLFDGAGMIQSGAPVQLVTAEANSLDRKRQLLADRFAGLDAQRKTMDEEIAALEQSLQFQDLEISLIDQDVVSMRQLTDQGLTAQSRLRESQRQQSALKRDRLEIQSFLARARHSRVVVDQQETALRSTMASENAEALRSLELSMARTDQTISALGTRIRAISRELEIGEAGEGPQATFTLVRRGKEVMELIQGSAHERLLPGDILEVDRGLEMVGTPKPL
jgi:polysaccharide export outer membrane protein